MLKQFFYFSKGQRTSIILLFCLIGLLIAIDLALPYLIPKQKSFFNEDFTAQVKAFEEELKTTEISNVKIPQTYTEKKQEGKIKPFVFDPNQIDFAGFIQLGIKPGIAKNILKYRSKGGRFKTKENFANIYGLSKEQYAKLEPYIQIQAKEKDPLPKNTDFNKEKQIKTIDLNLADTVALKTLKGIGNVYAMRIVAYRESLGGFVSTNQLREVYGMTNELFSQIEPFVTVGKTQLRTVDANNFSVERMKKHPYINFYQAKAIFELRKAKQHLTNIEELKHLEEFSETDLVRLAPYLNFDNH